MENNLANEKTKSAEVTKEMSNNTRRFKEYKNQSEKNKQNQIKMQNTIEKLNIKLKGVSLFKCCNNMKELE